MSIYHFNATVHFTHGEMKIEGTVIFVIATIADLEKREGWIKTVRNQDLIDAIDAARENVQRKSLSLEVGKTYKSSIGREIKITKEIEPGDEGHEAGYGFVSSTGRFYTRSGDHNDPDLTLVSEVTSDI